MYWHHLGKILEGNALYVNVPTMKRPHHLVTCIIKPPASLGNLCRSLRKNRKNLARTIRYAKSMRAPRGEFANAFSGAGIAPGFGRGLIGRGVFSSCVWGGGGLANPARTLRPVGALWKPCDSRPIAFTDPKSTRNLRGWHLTGFMIFPRGKSAITQRSAETLR